MNSLSECHPTHSTMTSGRSDDCRSLRRGLIATATTESPRRKRRRSRIPRPLVRVPIQRRTMTNTRSNSPAAALARALSPVWWETYAPHAGVRSVDGGQGPFHAPGSHGREWHPVFEGGSWG